MSTICNRLISALALLSVSAVWISSSIAAERIGNAANISNQVQGVLGKQARTLAVGSEVYLNELLRTGAASNASVVFLDDTNLSVGPQSEVTLDRFVYNPDRGQGAVVVRTGRGIFRFVTGSQRPQNYLIQTPIASIGVRGTIFDLLVEPNRMIVILIQGQVQVATFSNRRVWLGRPGTALTVYADGRIEGPVPWNGSIRVNFAGAQFPYFPPVKTAAKPTPPVNKTAKPKPPVVKAAKPTPAKVAPVKPKKYSAKQYDDDDDDDDTPPVRVYRAPAVAPVPAVVPVPALVPVPGPGWYGDDDDDGWRQRRPRRYQEDRPRRRTYEDNRGDKRRDTYDGNRTNNKRESYGNTNNRWNNRESSNGGNQWNNRGNYRTNNRQRTKKPY
jgi:hypothetical protein